MPLDAEVVVLVDQVRGMDPDDLAHFALSLNDEDSHVLDLAMAELKRERWVTDPCSWARDRLNVNLWSKQRQIIESVRDRHDTAVHSCHNVGKSFDAATAACWWLDVHEPGTAFVVTTAPTGLQVKAVLWREINRLYKRGQLPGRTNLTEWYIDGELVGMGRKPSDYSAASFTGIHAPFVLVIYDEACGIVEGLFDAGSSLTSNDTSRQLAIGNPDDPTGKFFRICQPASDWNVIRIAAHDAPNFTGEPADEIVLESTITPNWVEGKAREWGEDSPLFQSKCLGLFPTDAEGGVCPASMVMPCKCLGYPEGDPREAGLDFGASSGGDQTVLRERTGLRAGRVKRWREPDPMKLVGEIVVLLKEWGIRRVKTDANGIGWGVTGRLQELSRVHNPTSSEVTHDCEVVGVNVAESASQPDRFMRLRDEIWWEVGRENSRLKLWDLEACDDDTLADLTAPRYEIMDSKGKIKVEGKKEIRKRLGRSPDDADALLLAFYPAQSIVEMSAGPLVDARIPGAERFR